MGRSPCCSKEGLRRGPWSNKENALLIDYIQQHGEGQWRSLPKKAGLLRCGKSCRLRWMNYLRPGIKRGNISEDEEDLILRLHKLLGNRWSLIAGRLPGRTDNEIKNYWNTHLVKRLDNNESSKKSTKSGAAVEKKQDVKKLTATATDPQKIKVYAPKPIRISQDFRNDAPSTRDAFQAAKLDLPLSPFFDFEDFSFGDHVLPEIHNSSGDDSMLDIVYNEFRQLV